MTDLTEQRSITMTTASSEGWYVTLDGQPEIFVAKSNDRDLVLWLAVQLGVKLVPEPLRHAPDVEAEAIGSSVRLFPSFMRR